MLQLENRVVRLIVLLVFVLALSVFSFQSVVAETLSYDNSDTLASNPSYIPGARRDIIDFGIFDGGYVKSFVFGYTTTLSDPGKIEICFYKYTRDNNCPGTFLTSFQIEDLPGSPDGTREIFTVHYDIPASEEFDLGHINFGYSIEFYNSSTGVLLAGGG